MGVYMNSGAKRICTVQLYQNDSFSMEQLLLKNVPLRLADSRGFREVLRGLGVGPVETEEQSSSWSGKADCPSFSRLLGCSETAYLSHWGRAPFLS